jgi:hypothetical protein
MIAPALGAVLMCLAQPAMAQNNAPVAMIPKDSLARHDWVEECTRRLDAMSHMDTTTTLNACHTWWTYFVNGGTPVPGYGYAIPVRLADDRGAMKATVCMPHELECRPRR